MTTDPADLQSTSEGSSKRRATAEAMAAKQRDISVSEFFTKNRHLLGFDNPQKALLTSVKEAVDNSLDACEEAGILPTIKVTIEEVSEGRFRVTVEDNGPGIVKAQIPKIFAKLLYGSKFHRLKQSRGQQGIGISAAGMYGQLTTGRPIIITSKIGKGRPAYRMAVRIDARTNAPEVLEEQVVPWEQEHGTIVSIEMSGNYRGGRASVASYLEQTVVANPHLELTYVPPKGEPMHFPRASEQLPTETVEIKPHPYGVELGMLIKSFQEAGDRSARDVLMNDYSRVTEPVANELLKKAGVDRDARASRLDGPAIEAVHRVIQVSQASVPTTSKLLKALAKREDKFITAIQELGKNLTPALVDDLCKRAGFEPSTPSKKVELTQLERFGAALEAMQVRILPPPATCVAPIGEALIVEGLKRRFKAEFFASHTRPPAVYRGNPFVVEVGIAYGGELPKDESAEVLRFANRVPLLYQPRACATTEAVVRIAWKTYAKDGGINQRGAELPVGPLAVFVHLASVWVPFTNEAKEAIASYDEIVEEIRAALMECGRKLGTYLNSQVADKLQRERKSLFEKYIEEIAVAIGEITSLGTDRVRADFLHAMTGFVHIDETPSKTESVPPAASEGEEEIAPAPERLSSSVERRQDPSIDTASDLGPTKSRVPSRSDQPEPSVAPSVAARAATTSTVTSSTAKVSGASGEWPPRAASMSVASVTSVPDSAQAASTSKPSAKSWLEAELEARIAAKKIGAVTVAAHAVPAVPAAPKPTTTAVASPSSVTSASKGASAVATTSATKSAAPEPPAARTSDPRKIQVTHTIKSERETERPMRAGNAVVPAALASAVRASTTAKSVAAAKTSSASAKLGADKRKRDERELSGASPKGKSPVSVKKKSGASKGPAPRRGRR